MSGSLFQVFIERASHNRYRFDIEETYRIFGIRPAGGVEGAAWWHVRLLRAGWRGASRRSACVLWRTIQTAAGKVVLRRHIVWQNRGGKPWMNWRHSAPNTLPPPRVCHKGWNTYGWCVVALLALQWTTPSTDTIIELGAYLRPYIYMYVSTYIRT